MTPRQKETLLWVQRGATNKQIAKRLGISVSTVKLHVSALNKKYNVSNRTQLTVYSMSGQVAPPPLLPELKAEPFAWVHMHGNIVKGILFVKTKPRWLGTPVP